MNPYQQVEFHAPCGHLISAPADRVGQDVRCPHCHQVVRVPSPDVPYASAVPVPAGAIEPPALTALYLTALIAGLLGASLVHLVMFDEFSETELVTITPLWFFPIVFGLNETAVLTLAPMPTLMDLATLKFEKLTSSVYGLPLVAVESAACAAGIPRAEKARAPTTAATVTLVRMCAPSEERAIEGLLARMI